MLKKVFPFILLLVIFLFPLKASAAEKQFDISVESKYNVQEDGVTDISQTITITNKTEYYYTPTYTVSVGFSDISNIQAYNSDGSIPTTLAEKGDVDKSIKLSFPKRYAGLNEKNIFTLKFSTRDIAKKQGNVWEVTIPGIEKPEEFQEYTVQIGVPEEFGIPTIVKPARKANEDNSIELSKEEVGKSGVYILYGDKQYYSFSLKYNISNPNLFPVRTEIALPPQTSYQNVVVTDYSEEPINVTKDSDGNWIAEYRLLPQQKKSIVVKGVIEIRSESLSESLTNKQLKEYTTPRKYWDLGDKKNIAEIENLRTPEDIYKFVVKTLSYDYKKIATDNLRLGGKGALEKTSNSVCLEFTDLFISLARSKGIPARSVEGFAFTQNAKLRPLSLVNDILHAWPEYYDISTKKWVMVDPTWGNTTKGMDYFTSLDFSHVAFAIKGFDSEYPIPAGGYKFNKESKDVSVSFAKPSDFKVRNNIQISDNLPVFSFPKIDIQGTVKIENRGNTSEKNVVVDVRSSKNTKRQFIIDYLPPGGTREITTTFSDVPFLTNDKYLITIQVGKSIHRKEIKISFIPDYKILIIIGGIIGVSAIISAITFHTGSIYIQRRRRKNSLRRES